VRRLGLILAGALAATVVSAVVASCGDGGDDDEQVAGIEPVSASSCEAVEYGGSGEPRALIVSDLPMQGDSAERSKQQVEAIRLVFDQSHWRAGDIRVAFQACDDSIAETGLWDPGTCRENARAYARHPQVLGVIGTYNSGCAAEEIPILNGAGVAMISPGNTAVCLTEASSTCEEGQPGSLYPTGRRNYLRVVPNDAFQGAALAEFARERGIERPFVLYASGDPTSTGQASNFRAAARMLGIDVVGYATWDPEASDYSGLFREVNQAQADGVVLAGLIEQNGARLIADKVRVVGSNEEVPLLAFDGFSQQSTIDQAGAAASGMFASVPGRAAENLPPAGRRFVGELEELIGDQPVELFAPYAGEAADVQLDAIAKAGSNRAGVLNALFATARSGGFLGDYAFQASGDPSVGPITVLRAGETFDPLVEIVPSQELVIAARR
jgi:branched-chain amino acid transport system substrate-binding protein